MACALAVGGRGCRAALATSSPRPRRRSGSAQRRPAAPKLLTADLDGSRRRRRAASTTRSPRSASVDILVNNAGIIRRSRRAEHTDDDWDAVIEVNLSSAFRLSPRGRPAHDRSGGAAARSSTSRRCCRSRAASRVPAYAAAKGGAGAADQGARQRVGVARHQRQRDRARLHARPTTRGARATIRTRNRQITERIPAGRWGTPDDLAGAAVFLASSRLRLRARPRAWSSTADGWGR